VTNVEVGGRAYGLREILLIISIVCFVLAALGVWALLGLGMAFFAGSFLAV
jgi:hypothetical protein